MPTRLLLALVLLVAAPLLVLGWLSSAAIAERDYRARESLQAIFAKRLSESTLPLAQMWEDFESQLMAATQQGNDRAITLAELRRNQPLARLTVWVDRQGRILYPQLNSNTSTRQYNEIQLLEELVRGRTFSTNSNTQNLAENASQKLPRLTPHWGTWYYEQGLQIVLWIPGERGDWMGILLNRSAWISELLARLPDTGIAAATSTSPNSKTPLQSFDQEPAFLTRTLLLDTENHPVYQWSDAPATHSNPSAANDVDELWHAIASVSLPEPLGGWQLRYETQQPLIAIGTSSLPIIAALSGLGVMLISLGFYVATSLKRQLTLAAQQVSFSSQVSHELRTPLTNIQLYTEMAERDLQSLTGSPQTESLAQRLHVIGLESQRLSRLCDNVLALVRKPQSTIPDRSCRCIPDECIDACLDQFRPAFERLGVRIERHAAAAGWTILDRHALETVMMNLLSNVERYAAAGQWLQIDSRLLAGELVVRVADHGPGIPRRQWKRVFQPFVRLHSGINAPNGTGIGLSIALQVTSHAGGTLQILPAPRGTTIELVLPALQENDSCAS